MPPGVIWCADFEFGIRSPFICVEIGSFDAYNTQKKNDNFYEKYFLNFDPQKRIIWGRKVSHSIPKNVRNVLVFKSRL